MTIIPAGSDLHLRSLRFTIQSLERDLAHERAEKYAAQAQRNRPVTIVCPKCQLQMRPKTTGVAVEEMNEQGSYKLYSADLLVCPHCQFEVLAGFPDKPIAEHFHPAYHSILTSWKTRFKFWATISERERYEGVKR